MACGAADVADPATAGQYAAALAGIGRPALSITHTTKVGDAAYPFGSVFWHNLARITWSLTREGGRVLTCRKANNYPNVGREVLDITWDEGRPVRLVSATVEAKLSALLAEALMDGPASVDDLMGRLAEVGFESKRDTVGRALRRGPGGDPAALRHHLRWTMGERPMIDPPSPDSGHARGQCPDTFPDTPTLPADSIRTTTRTDRG